MKIKLSTLKKIIKEEIEEQRLATGVIVGLAELFWSAYTMRDHGDRSPGENARFDVYISASGLDPSARTSGAAAMIPQNILRAAQELMPSNSSPTARWVEGGRILFSFFKRYSGNLTEAQGREMINQLATIVASTIERAQDLIQSTGRSDMANVTLTIDTERTPWRAELSPR